MTIPVKWFHHGMTGAPAPGNAAGTLVSVLDACLINGFNTQSVSSLTFDSGTGICTATVTGGHGYVDYQVIEIAGATQTEFNGQFRISVVDALNFTYVPDIAPTVTTASGTITSKAAPIGGWSKAFSGVDKAAYVSTDPLATGNYLRVDDSLGTDGAQVTAYESMTDVDTGSIQWGDGYWRKSDASNILDEWALVGDSRAFYLMLGGGGGAARCVHFFGDFESFLAGDGYNCALTFNNNASVGAMNAAGCITDPGVFTGHVMAKNMVFLSNGEPWKPYAITATGIYPDPVTGGIVAIAGLPMLENNAGWRGSLPGAHQLLSPAHLVVHGLMLCLKGQNYVAIGLGAWR